MTGLERWLWTRHRLRLTWRGEMVRDAFMLAGIIVGCWVAWVLLAPR